ncbi:glycosyltransferase family 4 protein [uncultured Jatrophihabitans sp.]|uniref:glycosyltransferase family 4 protein n=1 Tax=uncultured Jatrophihabitans sp. TaxID=1610747 RepID=UPI0035CB83F3
MIHPTTFGGLHNMVARLHEPLLAHGYNSAAAVPVESDTTVFDRFAQFGVPTESLQLSRVRRTMSPMRHAAFAKNFAAEVDRLCGVAREFGAAAVQSHGVVNRHGYAAARKLGIPHIIQLNSDFAPRLLRRASARMLARAAEVMAEGDRVARAFPLGDRPPALFWPPVDTAGSAVSPAERSTLRRDLGLGDDDIVIGTIGNFSTQKGHDLLVTAAETVLARRPGSAFVIVGQPVASNARWFAGAVRSRVESSPVLRHAVRIVTPSVPASALLPAFDVYVVSSRGEGVATATLEAMCSGLPVVAFDVGSLAEVVDDGRTGHLVAPLDTAGLAEQLIDLIDDADQRARFGSAARAKAPLFSVEASALAHARAYDAAFDD